MADDRTSSQRQGQVTVKGIPGLWARKTGGHVGGDVTKVWNGGELQPEDLGGPPTTDNVVLTRPYKVSRDQALKASLAQQVMQFRGSISVWDTDPALGPIGKPTVYADALLVKCSEPDYDASSGEPQEWEIEFSVKGPSAIV